MSDSPEPPLDDELVDAGVPASYEAKLLWSADGMTVSALTQALRALFSLVCLLEIFRVLTGNMSEVTWDVLGSGQFYEMDTLGRNVTEAQRAEITDKYAPAGATLADLATLMLGVTGFLFLESAIEYSRPETGMGTVLYRNVRVPKSEKRWLKVWGIALGLVAFMMAGFFTMIAGMKLVRFSPMAAQGEIVLTNCWPMPGTDPTGRDLQTPLGKLGPKTEKDWLYARTNCGCRKDFIEANPGYWEVSEQKMPVSTSFVIGSGLGQVADAIAYLAAFTLGARWMFLLRAASGVATVRIKATRDFLNQPKEVAQDWGRVKREIRELCTVIIPGITASFSTALASNVVGFALMGACFLNVWLALQQSFMLTFVVVPLGFVVGPIFIPASVTSACSRVHDDLNELTEAAEIEQDAELDSTVKRHRKYLDLQNGGQGAGFVVFGMVVSTKLLKQALSALGTVALTLAASS